MRFRTEHDVPLRELRRKVVLVVRPSKRYCPRKIIKRRLRQVIRSDSCRKTSTTGDTFGYLVHFCLHKLKSGVDCDATFQRKNLSSGFDRWRRTFCCNLGTRFGDTEASCCQSIHVYIHVHTHRKPVWPSGKALGW